jgi:hypothetical protein
LKCAHAGLRVKLEMAAAQRSRGLRIIWDGRRSPTPDDARPLFAFGDTLQVWRLSGRAVGVSLGVIRVVSLLRKGRRP